MYIERYYTHTYQCMHPVWPPTEKPRNNMFCDRKRIPVAFSFLHWAGPYPGVCQIVRRAMHTIGWQISNVPTLLSFAYIGALNFICLTFWISCGLPSGRIFVFLLAWVPRKNAPGDTWASPPPSLQNIQKSNLIEPIIMEQVSEARVLQCAPSLEATQCSSIAKTEERCATPAAGIIRTKGMRPFLLCASRALY